MNPSCGHLCALWRREWLGPERAHRSGMPAVGALGPRLAALRSTPGCRELAGLWEAVGSPAAHPPTEAVQAKKAFTVKLEGAYVALVTEVTWAGMMVLALGGQWQGNGTSNPKRRVPLRVTGNRPTLTAAAGAESSRLPTTGGGCWSADPRGLCWVSP